MCCNYRQEFEQLCNFISPDVHLRYSVTNDGCLNRSSQVQTVTVIPNFVGKHRLPVRFDKSCVQPFHAHDAHADQVVSAPERPGKESFGNCVSAVAIVCVFCNQLYLWQLTLISSRGWLQASQGPGSQRETD